MSTRMSEDRAKGHSWWAQHSEGQLGRKDLPRDLLFTESPKERWLLPQFLFFLLFPPIIWGEEASLTGPSAS